jgi:hypothetical protein
MLELAPLIDTGPHPGVVVVLLLLPIAAAATINANSSRIQNPALIPIAAKSFLPSAAPAFFVVARAAVPVIDGAGRSWTSIMRSGHTPIFILYRSPFVQSS